MSAVLLNSFRHGGIADPLGALIAADSPYMWWRMDDLSGSVASDRSGNDRHGTHAGTAPPATAGGPSLVASGYGQSTDYGGNDYTTIPTAAWMYQTDFTVVCIAKLDSVSGHHWLVARDDAQGSTVKRHWSLRTDGTTFRSGYWDSVVSASTGDRSSGFTVAAATTYMFAMTVSGSGLNHATYLNGVAGSAYSLAGPIKTMNSVQPLEVGCYNDVGGSGRGFYLDGQVSEVAFLPPQSGARIAQYNTARLAVA